MSGLGNLWNISEMRLELSIRDASLLRVIFCKIRTSVWHGTSSIWLIFGM